MSDFDLSFDIYSLEKEKEAKAARVANLEPANHPRKTPGRDPLAPVSQ